MRLSGSDWIEGAVGCGAGTGGAGTSTVWGVPSVFTMSIIRFESIGDWAKRNLCGIKNSKLVVRLDLFEERNLTISFNFFANRRPETQGHLWFFGQEWGCIRYFIFQCHCTCFRNPLNIDFGWPRVLKINFSIQFEQVTSNFEQASTDDNKSPKSDEADRPWRLDFKCLLQSMWITNLMHFQGALYKCIIGVIFLK